MKEALLQAETTKVSLQVLRRETVGTPIPTGLEAAQVDLEIGIGEWTASCTTSS